PNLSAPGFSASLCRERTGCPGRPPPDRTPTLPGRSSLSADAPVLSPWPAAFPRSCARQKYTVLLDSLTWCRLRIPSGGLSRPWPQVSRPAGKTALPAHPGTALSETAPACCGPALSRPPKATESLLDTGTLPPVFGWNRSRTDIHIPIPRTTPADRLLIFSLSENMRGTIPCSSTPPTPRLPAAQGRS